MFSQNVLKYNRFGMKQERALLLTTHKMCNVKKKEFKRVIDIKHIKGCTKPTDPAKMEFVVHVSNEYDYHFVCESRDELFSSLKAVYFLQANKNLPIYAVSENLKNVATSKKDVKADVEKVPDAKYRLTEEDVYEPLGSQSSASTMGSSDSEDDF